MGALKALALAVLFAGAVVARLYGVSRGLWTAEAWVANSAAADSLRQVFYYDAWLQTSPPLFLLLVRWTVELLGFSNWSLRLVPLVFGLACVLLVALLSRRAFRPPYAFLCTALVAFSPFAIQYSKELKQYTADSAATALLLLLLWRYKWAPDARAYGRLLLAFAVLPLLSYTVFMVLPLTVAVLMLTSAGESWRTRWWRSAAVVLVAGIEGAASYAAFVRPNLAPNLSAFWRWGFPPGTGFGGMLAFYVKYFAAMGVYFWVPDSGRAGATSVVAIPRIVLLLLVAMAAGLLAVAVARCRREARRIWLAAFAGLPVLTLAAFNVAGLYPAGARKLTLFLLPCVAVGIALVCELLCETLPGRLAWVGAFAGVAVVAAAGWTDARRPIQDEDVDGALHYLRNAAGADDRIYIHASVAEPAKVYLRMLRWKGAVVAFGDTGYPCCTRAQEPAAGGGERADREISKLLAANPRGDVWLLFTGRREHWEGLRRDDSDLASNRARQAGCREHPAPLFSNVVLQRFRCSGL